MSIDPGMISGGTLLRSPSALPAGEKIATIDAAGNVTARDLLDGDIPAGITRDSELAAAISAAINALLDGAPGALDTLNELAASVGDDADFAGTVTAALAARQLTSEKGQANGYASLDGSALLPIGQLPSIAGLTSKGSPVAGDILVIEDSEAANVKKKILISSLPGGGNAFGTITPQNAGNSGTNVVADSAGDTLLLNALYGGSIAGDAGNDRLDLSMIGVHMFRCLIGGDIYYGPPCTSHNTSVAVSANELIKVPIRVSNRMTLDTLAISVSSTGAGNVRFGLRRIDPATGVATTLVVDAGAVDVSTSGVKAFTGLGLTLEPGYYFGELVSNVSCSLRGVSATNALGILGLNMPTAAAATVTGYSRSYTYGALPADETAQTSQTVVTGSIPCVFYR